MAKKRIGWKPEGIENYLSGSRFYSDADVDQIISAAGGLPDGKIIDWLPTPDKKDMADQEVERRAALTHRLERAAHWWAHQSNWQARPAPSEIIDALKKIAKAAARLREALCISDPADPDSMPSEIRQRLRAQAEAMGEKIGGYPHHRPMHWPVPGREHEILDYGGASQLRDDIQGIGRILQWVNAAVEREENKKVRTAKKPKRKPDMATKELLGSLAGIWIDVFEKAPKVSFTGGNSRNKGKPAGAFFKFTRAAIKPLPITLTDGALGERLHAMFGRVTRAINVRRSRDSLAERLLLPTGGGKSRRKKI